MIKRRKRRRARLDSQAVVDHNLETIHQRALLRHPQNTPTIYDMKIR